MPPTPSGNYEALLHGGRRAVDGIPCCRLLSKSTEMMRAGPKGLSGLSLTEVPSGQIPVWLYFPIVIDPELFGMNRDELALALEHENISVRKYFEVPCHHISAYKAQSKIALPNTERAAYNVLALPVYNDMTAEECNGITQAIREIHQQAGAVRGALELARCAS